MMQYPDVQAKAQAELDSILGTDTLPTLNDEDSLPFCKAVIKECLRWQTVAPLGVPHVSTEEDVYNGYTIPVGSIVIGNAWLVSLSGSDLLPSITLEIRAMFHDEIIYPDSYTFNPERFIKNGKIDLTVRDPDLIAFGFGRRIWFVLACCRL